MNYEIQTATIENLPEILKIYAQAREFMRQNGNPNQWMTHHPAESILRRDIEERKLHLCVENGEILGVFYYTQGIDPTYVRIFDGNWLNDRPYHVIHRIAAFERGHNVAAQLLD